MPGTAICLGTGAWMGGKASPHLACTFILASEKRK